MPLDQLLAQTGLDKIVVITSHERTPENNRKNKGAKNSWHLKSRADAAGRMAAYDVVPRDGYTFDDLFNALVNSPEFTEWATVNEFNINPETNRSGYRPHFHLGPDFFAYGDKKYSKKYTS